MNISSVFDNVGLQAIDFYKTYLSGKYLFKDKACTFQDDTCSQYARRAVEERGLVEGAILTRERLHRCHDYRIFAIDRETLAWGQGFEKIVSQEQTLDALVGLLHEKGESQAVIGHILNGSQAVHKYTCQKASPEITELIEREGVGEILPRVKNASEYAAYFKRKRNSALTYAAGGALVAAALGIPEIAVFGLVTYGIYIKSTYNHNISFFDQFKELGKIRKESIPV